MAYWLSYLQVLIGDKYAGLKYKYKYFKFVLEYNSSTSTSTKYYISGGYHYLAEWSLDVMAWFANLLGVVILCNYAFTLYFTDVIATCSMIEIAKAVKLLVVAVAKISSLVPIC